MIRTITATHYVTPLREGGSLPAIVEGSDDGTWVVKFRGAGQGPRALIAELVSGEIARRIGLPVPEIVFVEVDPRMAKTEPDPEIQDLLRNSEGLNLALDYLPGSIAFDPVVDGAVVDAALASSIVWFDSLVTNVDRTPRNTNLLVWHKRLWLIDHGASLYFHHAWDDWLARSSSPFAAIRDHVLLPWADDVEAAHARLARVLTDDVLEEIVALIPETWLTGPVPFSGAAEHRQAYVRYLRSRLENPAWVEEVARARSLRV